MSGSTFGQHFRITTWGESHGLALGVVVDGCPAGLSLCEADIQCFLDRRKPGTSPVTTSRREADEIKILSGIFEGVTTGTPISLLIENTSQHSGDYGNLADCYRPGHADYTFDQKYGVRDYRGGGRSSGRETAARVAAGAIACKILSELHIELHAYTRSIGPVSIPDSMGFEDYALHSPTGMPDLATSKKAEDYILQCREELDSIGGVIECTMDNVPAGIGEPVFDKLDAMLSHAIFSIGGVKAVEIGDGILVSKAKGSQNNDSMHMENNKVCFDTNHSGGILGGLSNGATISLRAHVKPTPSIYQTQRTVTKQGLDTEISIKGRHDPVIVPRAVVVVESMCALTLVDLLFENMCSTMQNIKKIY